MHTNAFQSKAQNYTHAGDLEDEGERDSIRYSGACDYCLLVPRREELVAPSATQEPSLLTVMLKLLEHCVFFPPLPFSGIVAERKNEARRWVASLRYGRGRERTSLTPR